MCWRSFSNRVLVSLYKIVIFLSATHLLPKLDDDFCASLKWRDDLSKGIVLWGCVACIRAVILNSSVITSLRQIYRREAMNDALQEEKWEGQVLLGITSHIPINVCTLTLRPFGDHSLHYWMIFTCRWRTSQHHSKQCICSLSVTFGCVGSLREWLTVPLWHWTNIFQWISLQILQ